VVNFYGIFSKIYERAGKKMCLDCRDFVKKNSKILDLGCGSGIITKNFQDFFHSEVLGTDIKDNRVYPIPFKIIDGKSLPFPDNSFDTVLISYVLHHSGNPISLLKEAKRVAKDKIIIYEDLMEGILSKLRCKIHGASFNAFFKIKNQASFRSEKEWEKIFADVGLKIVFKKRINNFPTKKQLFICQA